MYNWCIVHYLHYRYYVVQMQCDSCGICFPGCKLCIGTTYMCLHCIHHKGTCHLLNNSSSVCTSEQGRSISHIDNLFLLLSSLQPGVWSKHQAETSPDKLLLQNILENGCVWDGLIYNISVAHKNINGSLWIPGKIPVCVPEGFLSSQVSHCGPGALRDSLKPAKNLQPTDCFFSRCSLTPHVLDSQLQECRLPFPSLHRGELALCARVCLGSRLSSLHTTSQRSVSLTLGLCFV